MATVKENLEVEPLRIPQKLSYATRGAAVAAVQAQGFAFLCPDTMGAAGWHKGASYAWITEDWSPKHGKYRFSLHTAGA